MSLTININGVICNEENAKISVLDRGFLYGDSVYEVTYSQDSRFLFLDEHLDRLWNSASLLGMEIEYSRPKLIEEILKTARSSALEQAYVRVVITGGSGSIDLSRSSIGPQNLVIYVKERPLYPLEMYEKGINLKIVSRPRNDRRSLDPNAKSGNYLNNVLAIQEARKHGAYDAIMANINGEITEGSTFNIWMVKDGVVITPHENTGLLKGITRQKVIELCQAHAIELELGRFSAHDLYRADEVFITSSTKGIMPVSKVDGASFGVGNHQAPITQLLRQHYNQLVSQYLKSTGYSYANFSD